MLTFWLIAPSRPAVAFDYPRPYKSNYVGIEDYGAGPSGHLQLVERALEVVPMSLPTTEALNPAGLRPSVVPNRETTILRLEPLVQKRTGVSAGETDSPEISTGGAMVSTSLSLRRSADGIRSLVWAAKNSRCLDHKQPQHERASYPIGRELFRKPLERGMFVDGGECRRRRKRVAPHLHVTQYGTPCRIFLPDEVGRSSCSARAPFLQVLPLHKREGHRAELPAVRTRPWMRERPRGQCHLCASCLRRRWHRQREQARGPHACRSSATPRRQGG